MQAPLRSTALKGIGMQKAMQLNCKNIFDYF